MSDESRLLNAYDVFCVDGLPCSPGGPEFHRGNLHRDRPGTKAKLIILADKLGSLRNITMVYSRTVLSVITIEMPDRKQWLAHDP